ncbi:DMT family transporter [Candidatus Thioglobus sp.]|nr:DMT family transporter [Candidatus Thioglobus sp.]
MNFLNKTVLKGIGLMLLGMSTVPFLDVFAKLLSEDYSVMQVTWTRFFFHACWLIPIILWQQVKWKQVPESLGLQFVRGLMLTLATLFFFAAIKSNPIPNALTLLFISPLVVAVLSPAMLGERFDSFIGAGVVIGFLGVVVVLQPTGDEFKPSLLLAVVSGICYALYIIFTKKLTFKAPPVLTLFYSAAVGILLMLPLALFTWTPPDMRGVILGAAMGFFAAASHFMIIKAFEFASASELSPFNYFEIVGAISLSYIIFGYIPNFQAVIGLFIIMGSGLFVSWRVMKNNDNHTEDKEKLIEPL